MSSLCSKEVREGIVTPLYLIFKKSLEEGKVLTAWKDASVMVRHKSRDKILHPIIVKLVSLLWYVQNVETHY